MSDFDPSLLDTGLPPRAAAEAAKAAEALAIAQAADPSKIPNGSLERITPEKSKEIQQQRASERRKMKDVSRDVIRDVYADQAKALLDTVMDNRAGIGAAGRALLGEFVNLETGQLTDAGKALSNREKIDLIKVALAQGESAENRVMGKSTTPVEIRQTTTMITALIDFRSGRGQHAISQDEVTDVDVLGEEFGE